MEIVKINLGIEILLHNIFKLALLTLLAVCLNILVETIVLLASFSILRRYAFGSHADSSLTCTALTLILFPMGVYISRMIIFEDYMIFIIYSFYAVLVYKYAPRDTKVHPILNIRLKKRLRNKSVLVCIIYMIISYIIPNHMFKALFIMGTSLEVLCIHPMIYKIIKRRKAEIIPVRQKSNEEYRDVIIE